MIDEDRKLISLIPPYGGKLISLLTPPDELEELTGRANELESLQVSRRSVCDLEMLAVGGFSPLDRFMGQEDFQSVMDEMVTKDGHIFPLPVTLPVSDDAPVKLDQDIALRDSRNELLAILSVEEIYPWDRSEVAEKVLGTQDVRHPLVSEMHRWGPLNVSGQLNVIQLPRHYDFAGLRLTPSETRARLEMMGRANVVAFQTRNPLHRVHEELTRRAIEETDGSLLLHPAAGMTRPGDVDHYTRVRTYKAFVSNYFDEDRILLALLPLAMRLAGPREAIWHALIRRNYGANMLIVGRDHASPGMDSRGNPFYQPLEAQEFAETYSEKLGMQIIPFGEFAYLPEEERYEEVKAIPRNARIVSISGTEIREEYLNNGRPLPDWYARPEVAEILADAYPPRHKQGACIWLTGLSGAGKSTTAEVLTSLLLEAGRQVTLLDGDVVRTNLSKGLGFSKEDRDTNIRRIGFVASEIVRHGGIAVCAAVSPYEATRNDVRNMVGSDHFIEVFVDTPLEVCEARDTKGMYAKARRGEIAGFTGIDDPYEAPEFPEITLETVNHTPEANARKIVNHLLKSGFLRDSPDGQ